MTTQTRQSFWPQWFPYPSSFLRAAVLMMWMFIVLRVALFWGGITGLAFSGILHHPEPVDCYQDG